MAFGRQQTVRTSEVSKEAHTCVNCGKKGWHGIERTFRTDYTAFGVPLYNVEHGANQECETCFEADSIEYFERAGKHDDHLEVDEEELAEIENEFQEASA